MVGAPGSGREPGEAGVGVVCVGGEAAGSSTVDKPDHGPICSPGSWRLEAAPLAGVKGGSQRQARAQRGASQQVTSEYFPSLSNVR